MVYSSLTVLHTYKSWIGVHITIKSTQLQSLFVTIVFTTR